MTTRLSTSILVLSITVLLGGCGFEHASNPVAPTSGTQTTPSATPTPSTPTLTGTWAAEPEGAGAAPASCGSFEWRITSQTATTLAGEFSAVCSPYTMTGTGSGQLTGGQNVTVTVTGTGTAPGLAACGFSLTGSGTVVNNDTLPATYSGTTCLGPMQGTVTLRRASFVTVDAPTLLSPADGAALDTTQPALVAANVSHSGPIVSLTYLFQVATDGTFSSNLLEGSVGEQSGQTSFTVPQALAWGTTYYWRAQAADPARTGPWSAAWRFTTPAAPTPTPTPTPTPMPTPSPSPWHVPPGPLTVARAEQVVYATANEFPQLTSVFGSDAEAENAAEELLLRTIWHLQLAGYQAGRQRNPSGAISKDKLTISIDGSWHAYDIFSLGYAGRATTVQFLEVWPADYVADAGIAD